MEQIRSHCCYHRQHIQKNDQWSFSCYISVQLEVYQLWEMSMIWTMTPKIGGWGAE